MKRRISIVLDDSLIRKLHDIQSKLIVSTNSSVSLSSVVGLLLSDAIKNQKEKRKNC